MDLKFPIWLYNKEQGGVIVKSQEHFETLKGKWVESPALFDAEEHGDNEQEPVKEHKKRGPKSKDNK